MTDEKQSIFNRLRRLQEQNRSDIPAMLTNRAMSSFTLHQESIPVQSATAVNVVIYPQDPFVGDPEVREMTASDIRPGLLNDRVEIQDTSARPAQPDSQGNYLYWPGTPEFDQLNSFYYTTFTLRMYERYAHRALPWSFPAPRITVNPHAGNGANAFYSEQDRLLGFHSFVFQGKSIYAAQSADVVSHETAHAVLDGVRDLYNESFGMGGNAFHESFGDMTAILVAMHDDSLIKRLVGWTGGNLRLDNFIATLAEEITNLLRSNGEPLHGRTVYLRNAFNTFRYVPFDNLPYYADKPETELARESHNYSRLFTGAFYDILLGLYEWLKVTNEPRLAIHRTRDIAGQLLMCAVELGPVGELDFKDMAKAFLAADNLLYDGHHINILIAVFDQRSLLTAAEAAAWLAELRGLPDVRLPEVMNSSMAAAMFLEDRVIPALPALKAIELTPMGAYRNASGNVFLTYFAHRRMTLQGTQYRQFDGAHIDAFGGLTLAFDAKGRLRSVFLRPVTDEDLRQINILTAELIADGQIVSGGQVISSAAHLHMHPEQPTGLWVASPPLLDTPGQPGEAKLVKFPVLFDDLPGHDSDFWSYLTAWRRKLGI